MEREQVKSFINSQIRLYTKFYTQWQDPGNIAMAQTIMNRYTYILNKMEQEENDV